MYFRSGFSCHLINMSEGNTIRYDIMSDPGHHIGDVKFDPESNEWVIRLEGYARVSFGYITQIQTCLLGKLARS